MTTQAAIPLKWYVPFATGDASRVEIPVTSSDATRASQTLGFPPLTMQPPAVGGVPPQGEDFNGAMNQVARVAWWVLNGGGWPYDATFATNSNINGYPNGAVLQSADFLGQWINTADNNQINPDTVGTSWVPGFQYGATAITGQTGGTTTLTPLQAAKRGISISGTLTSALVVILPTWIKDWSVTNNTTGAFTVIVKTLAGSGVTIPQNGQPTAVAGDGTNVTQTPQNVPAATTSTNPLQFGQAGHGQCRLSVASATLLTLKPFNGANVIVNGIPLTLPAAGVSISNAGLAASTAYFVYLSGTTAAPALVLSTTTHATNATNGVEVQAGNAALTLVGMVYSNASSQFTTNVTNTGVFVLNWFFRQRQGALQTLSTTTNFTNTSPAKLTAALDIIFLAWAGDIAEGFMQGVFANTTLNSACFAQAYIDGTAWGGLSFANSAVAGANNTLVSRGIAGLSDGAHTFSTFAYVNGNTGSTSNVLSQLTVQG